MKISSPLKKLLTIRLFGVVLPASPEHICKSPSDHKFRCSPNTETCIENRRHMSVAGIARCAAYVVLATASTLVGQLTISPQQASFPTVPYHNPYGFSQFSEVTLTFFAGDGEVNVSKLLFSNNLVFTATPSGRFSISPGRSKQVVIRFTPNAADQFNGAMDVIGNAGTIATVPLLAIADCWSPFDCEPKGPTCIINKNNEPWQPWTVPNFFKTVSPALDDQASLNAKLVDYDLPLDFVLKIAGLSGIVKFNPPLKCDDKSLHCTRIKGSPTRARFQRAPGSGLSVADGTIGLVSVHVEIPNDMSGITAVGGGYSEFVFDRGKAPKLQINSNGVPVFDGDLTCVNSTFISSTIRQLGSGTVPPKLNMEIR